MRMLYLCNRKIEETPFPNPFPVEGQGSWKAKGFRFNSVANPYQIPFPGWDLQSPIRDRTAQKENGKTHLTVLVGLEQKFPQIAQKIS